MFYRLSRVICYLFLFVTISCSGDSKGNSGKCKFGTPVAVFSNTLEKVKAHSFTQQAQKAVETVQFENGVSLELIQTGCNEIKQSFTFTLSKDLEGDEAFWIEQAENQFRYLAMLSNKYASYALWANVFDQGAHLIRLGETFEPEPNTFINVDRIPSADHNLLVITLERKG